MIQFHKSNKNQWTNKFACGENMGKEQTKSPFYNRRIAISVIRLGFAKMRCFTAVVCVLLVLFVLVNMLIYNAINAFVVVWVGDKIPDFA